MQRFLSIALALCLGLTSASTPAPGKLRGGGKSFGSAPTHQTRQADAPTSAAQAGRCRHPAATAAAGRAAFKASSSALLGSLAGIAAGSLLAAMSMATGFEGIQFLDILLLA